jgi:1,4-alpha-glucan branching enzyme
MHDTLRYLGMDPVLRSGCHDWITFHQWYAYDERWVLPLSHDEVVHGKGSLLDKMWGDYHQRLAQLRLLLGYQVAVPGRILLFQGGEFGMGPEWNYEQSLPWYESEQPERQGLRRFLAAALACYRSEGALHRLDDQRQGFAWVDVENRAESLLAFMRKSYDAPQVLVACNFTPVARSDYPLWVDQEGDWSLILDSDAVAFGGTQTEAEAQTRAWRHDDGRICLRVHLPALSIRFWRAPG